MTKISFFNFIKKEDLNTVLFLTKIEKIKIYNKLSIENKI